MHERFPDAHLRLHRQGRARAAPRRRLGRARRRRAACSSSRRSSRSTTRSSRASTRATPPPTRRARSTLLRAHGIEIRPSWLPFTPWTTRRRRAVALLDFVAEHDLVGNVDPVQYTIRLLLPAGLAAARASPTSRLRSARTTTSARRLPVAQPPTPRSTTSSARLAGAGRATLADGDADVDVYAACARRRGVAAGRPHRASTDRPPRLTEPGSAAPSRPTLQLGALDSASTA